MGGMRARQRRYYHMESIFATTRSLWNDSRFHRKRNDIDTLLLIECVKKNYRKTAIGNSCFRNGKTENGCRFGPFQPFFTLFSCIVMAVAYLLQSKRSTMVVGKVNERSAKPKLSKEKKRMVFHFWLMLFGGNSNSLIIRVLWWLSKLAYLQTYWRLFSNTQAMERQL